MRALEVRTHLPSMMTPNQAFNVFNLKPLDGFESLTLNLVHGELCLWVMVSVGTPSTLPIHHHRPDNSAVGTRLESQIPRTIFGFQASTQDAWCKTECCRIIPGCAPVQWSFTQNILFWCLDIENHWRSLIWNFTFHPSGHSLFGHWQNLLKLRISLKTSKKLSLFCSPSFSSFTWYFITMESRVSIHQRKVSIKPVGNQHCIEGTDKCTAGHATHLIMSGLWWNKTHPIIWGLQNL